MHFGRLFIPLLVLVALAYGLPMLIPHQKKPEGVADLKLLDSDAVLSDATRTFESFAKSLPSSDLADVEKLKAMAENAPQTAQILLAPTALLNQSTLLAFAYSLYTPLNSELWGDDDAVKATAERLASGFAMANALGLWLELLGYYVGFVYGTISTLGLFDHLYLGSGLGLDFGMLLELCLAVAVAYLLYWAVLHSGDAGHKLVAACVYCLFAVVNLLYGLLCLWGGIEPLRFVAYLLKVAAAAGCAYYTIKIRAKAMGVDLTADFAGETSPRDKEDYVVVTAQHQPTPPFPGKPAVPPTELV